jgi:hypothetical protein
MPPGSRSAGVNTGKTPVNRRGLEWIVFYVVVLLLVMSWIVLVIVTYN